VLRLILLTLVFLTVPARAHDITGKWEFDVQLPAGSGTPSFVFKQSGEKLAGTYTGLMGTAEVTGSVKGDDIEFSFEASIQDQKGKVVYKGKVESATQMKGDVDYAGLGKGTWTAKKK
jgi:hypothetical protein